jgi:hypothetical protein
MTLLLSWLGVDSRGPASVYIASDSRISWATNDRWDQGRKVFGFKNHPDILGYCGDVLFPSQVLSQLVDLGDAGLLFSPSDDCKTKFEAIKEKMVQLFHAYPHGQSRIMGDYLGVLHASRDLQGRFFCHLIEWHNGTGWSGREAKYKSHSDKLLVLGSGSAQYLLKFKEHWASQNTRTSRAVFHSFCDSLSETTDPYCGGAPQLVGLYRRWNSFTTGIIWKGRRYFLGVDITNLGRFDSVEWRNELFERCDGGTMQRLPDAQKQPNPMN